MASRAGNPSSRICVRRSPPPQWHRPPASRSPTHCKQRQGINRIAKQRKNAELPSKTTGTANAGISVARRFCGINTSRKPPIRWLQTASELRLYRDFNKFSAVFRVCDVVSRGMFRWNSAILSLTSVAVFSHSHRAKALQQPRQTGDR